MYLKLGVSAVVGGLVIVLSAPVQFFVGRGMSKMQKKVMVTPSLVSYLTLYYTVLIFNDLIEDCF